ncbi:uncharacterized protein MONOS_12078 [Monocercomonoides exilis]|uniref:uncharacterized protein n=1 Tax=Monocercomonoides exilis TaxID=2049356 RepID=UPI00355A913A|nr:hypothetical protein MONOS_12078 [Monocercomonoides exilis]
MPFSYQKAESNELFKIFDSPKNSHEVKTYPENLNSFTQSFSNIPESFQNFPSFDFDPSVLPFSVEDSIFQSNPSSGISQVITRSTHNSDSKEPMLVPNPNSRYLPYSQTPHHSSYTSSRIRSDQKSPFEQSTSIYKNPSQYAIQYPTWTVPSHVPPSIPPPGDPLPSPMYLGSDQQGSKRTIDFLRRFSDEGNIENR